MFSIHTTIPPATDARTILQRADEVSTILRMLSEPQSSAVILTGSPGAGKSTLAALVYHHLQEAAQIESRGIRHLVWLTLGPNATLPDMIAAILSSINIGSPDFFLLKPEQQIALLLQALRRPQENVFIVLDQFEEMLNPETGQGTLGRGAIALFFEMMQQDIGTSRLLLTSYRSPNSSNNGPASIPNAQTVPQMGSNASAPGSAQVTEKEKETRIRSYLVSRVSIPEGVALLQQRGVQGSHQELSLVWQRCAGHVFALVLFSILTTLSGFSLSFLLNSPDYAPMWNGDVTLNLIGMIYYYLNPVQRTLMRALCLFIEPVPLEAIATAIMGGSTPMRPGEDDRKGGRDGGHNASPYMLFKRELSLLVELSLVQETSKSIGQHTYFLHPLLRQYTIEHYLEGSDRQGSGDLSIALGVTAPPNPIIGNPEARQIALAAGHMRVAAYYAYIAQQYCPPREKRHSLQSVEPILAMIYHLCLGWHWQEAYNLLSAEGLQESMVQWGALNTLIGLYAEMLSPLKVLNQHDFGEVSSQLGLLYSRLGDFLQSRAYFEQALEVQREIGDKYGEAITLANQGELFRNAGELQQARDNFLQALALNRQHQDAHLQSVVLHNLGLVHQAAKDYAQAFSCFSESLKLAHKLKDSYNEGMILSNIGILLYEQGRLAEAVALLSYAVRLRQSLQDLTVNVVIDFLKALEQKMGPEAFARLSQSPQANYNLGTHDLISRLVSS